MTNYTKINIGTEDRAELHDKLGLTGAEVSVNRLPAGAGVPFVHSHRRNEEIYGILAGAGRRSSTERTSPSPLGTGCGSPRLPSDSSPRRRIPASPMSAFKSRRAPWAASPRRTPSCTESKKRSRWHRDCPDRPLDGK